MINPKIDVEKLFISFLNTNKNLSVISETSNVFGYYKEDACYERLYYCNDTSESISKRILMDAKIESFLSKSTFAAFLLETMDPNVLMVMQKLVLLWDDDEGMSLARDELKKEYADEYAQYIAEDLLGQTWVERQIMVVNVSVIYQSCVELFMPYTDGSFKNFFINALLQTIFHESRHLFYECNEIVPIGVNTNYPKDGGTEEEVEFYGNVMAHKYVRKFLSGIKDSGIHRNLPRGKTPTPF